MTPFEFGEFRLIMGFPSYVKQNNNLRDMYLRSILLGGQKEELYEETDTNQIARAFRRAGKAVLHGKNS